MTDRSVLCVLFALACWSCGSTKTQAQVVEVSWSHRVDLRVRKKATGDTRWPEPDTAGFFKEETFDVSCRNKKVDRKCVKRDDKNNCVAWKDVFQRWCRYSYWDWAIEDTKYTTGIGHDTTWPAFDSSKLNKDHRESRSASYAIKFSTGDRSKHWTHTTKSKAEFDQFVVGDLWIIRIPYVGSAYPESKSSLEAN